MDRPLLQSITNAVAQNGNCFFVAWAVSKSALVAAHDRPKPKLSKWKGITIPMLCESLLMGKLPVQDRARPGKNCPFQSTFPRSFKGLNSPDELQRSYVGSMVEWLTHRTDDQHGLGSKPTCAILLCSWEKHFTALSPAWWS